MIEWSTTSALSASHGVKFLVYGNAGTGKTMLIPTAPAPLLISAENGLLSLTRKNIERVHGVNTPGISYDIPVAKVRTVADLTEVFDLLKIPANRAKYNVGTICLDSISEIAEICLANALTNNKDGRMAYGDMAEQMLHLFRCFRDLEGVNVYFSAKQGFCKDSNLMGPSLPGNILPREVPYLFDELFHLHLVSDAQGNPVRVLRTAPDSENNAKDRSGALDPRGEWPSLANIMQKISAA